MSSVDVIVPCYKYGHYLRECVGSALSQEGPSVRVLIIDDASSDNSAEVAQQICREDSRVSFSHHAVNKGHIATYNEGNDWASADYTLLISADDYLLPGAFSRAVGIMDNNPQVAFTFGKAIGLYDDGTTKVIGIGLSAYDDVASLVLPGHEFIEASGAKNRVPTPTPVVRTSCLKQVGGYRPELPHTADMELWWRLAAHGSVGMVGECQAVYRKHAGNMSWDYYTKHWLPDLHQRKDAINLFLQSCSHRLPNADRVREGANRSLGLEALGFASTAFNEGETEISQQLIAFALAVCPRVQRSLPWVRLGFKKTLGPKTWNALRPAIAKIRHALHSKNG
jgi:glycosyltransferase involved in cell wall biosynthesis